jgi:FtsH-binding integral membrane protein
MEQGPFGNQSVGSARLGGQSIGAGSIAVENARFMSRVYGWMAGGLCLTGAVAWKRGRQSRPGANDLRQPAAVLALIIAQSGPWWHYRR